MFEYLDKSNIQNVFPAGHQAIQIIRKQWVYALLHNREDLNTGLNSDQSDLTNRIIQDIETAEKQKIEDLPPATIDKYIKILVERIEQLSRQELNVNQSVGKNLLNELRSSNIGSVKR